MISVLSQFAHVCKHPAPPPVSLLFIFCFQPLRLSQLVNGGLL